MSYDIILIAVLLVVAYIFTYVFYRRNIIRKSLHNKIWNIIFLLSFILTAGLGTIQAGLSDFAVNFPLLSDLNFWHIEFGIVFAVILFFHLIDNWSSFRKLITNVA